MSAERESGPWGTVLVILTLLACANALYQPFERDEDAAVADLVSERRDPLVRHTPRWTPARRATITPGIQTITDGAGQCTTNFVFTDAAGTVYLGQAAHCARVGHGMNGCRARTRPLGTRVTFNTGVTTYDRGRQLARGRLVYSSWRTMQRLGETHKNRCSYNDFALVRLPHRSRPAVNPSLPYWGGPTGLTTAEVSIGDQLYGYGRSSLREDGSHDSRQAATAMSDRDETHGWSHTISSRSPGIPGDSGSAYVDGEGRAVGTLSTLRFGLLFVRNGLGDLAKELRYARRHSGIVGLRLELGTEPFHRERAAASVRSAP